jgi:hypothetical protein
MALLSSSFRHDVDENWASFGTLHNVNTLEYGTDTLSRNVGKELPLDAAYYPKKRRTQ